MNIDKYINGRIKESAQNKKYKCQNVTGYSLISTINVIM